MTVIDLDGVRLERLLSTFEAALPEAVTMDPDYLGMLILHMARVADAGGMPRAQLLEHLRICYSED